VPRGGVGGSPGRSDGGRRRPASPWWPPPGRWHPGPSLLCLSPLGLSPLGLLSLGLRRLRSCHGLPRLRPSCRGVRRLGAQRRRRRRCLRFRAARRTADPLGPSGRPLDLRPGRPGRGGIERWSPPADARGCAPRPPWPRRAARPRRSTPRAPRRGRAGRRRRRHRRRPGAEPSSPPARRPTRRSAGPGRRPAGRARPSAAVPTPRRGRHRRAPRAGPRVHPPVAGRAAVAAGTGAPASGPRRHPAASGRCRRRRDPGGQRGDRSGRRRDPGGQAARDPRRHHHAGPRRPGGRRRPGAATGPAASCRPTGAAGACPGHPSCGRPAAGCPDPSPSASVDPAGPMAADRAPGPIEPVPTDPIPSPLRLRRVRGAGRRHRADHAPGRRGRGRHGSSSVPCRPRVPATARALV
jgi:hypothetical protein